MKIREVIVVEGRHDEALLKQCFECDVVVTGGLALNDDILERIRQAKQTRGVVILTDPDSRATGSGNGSIRQYQAAGTRSWTKSRHVRSTKSA